MTPTTFLRRSTPWLLAAALSSASLTLWAQSGAPSASPSPQAGAHPTHGPMVERMKARHGQHLKALKDKLQLSAEQEPAWSAFASAMSPPAQRPERPNWQEIAQLKTPERIDRLQALQQQRQSEMNALMARRGQAAKTFYASLNNEQQKVFDEETRKHLAQRGEHGGARHHGHHGHHGRS